MSMELLYRIFYVIFAMDLAAVALFPVVLVLRFVMRDMHRKYMVWIWRLYFLRLLCPLAVSSVFSIVPAWNRFYHRLLSALGLSLQGEYGFLTGWHTVFETGIETTIPYRICAWVWLGGGLILGILLCFRQKTIRREIKRDAVQLEGRIYQSAVQTPVMLGMLRCRYYLPRQMEARQLRYLMPHMEAQRIRKSQWWRMMGFLILLLHWYQPLAWAAYSLAKRDEEMACDDLAVRQLGEGEALLYAQSLLNLAKEEVMVPYTTSVIFETDLEKRAARMLYYRPSVPRQRLSALLLASLLLLWSFGLRPLQMAWNGGTWEREGTSRSVAKSQMDQEEGEVIGTCAVTSSTGLELVLRLVMTTGEHADHRYKGRFALELLDSMGDVLDMVSLKQSWKQKGLSVESMVFPEGLTMQTGDYNGDGLPELLLGQQMEWTEEQAEAVQD
nr:M56 family metallopeptidase [Lachnospiraceae bacterium]